MSLCRSLMVVLTTVTIVGCTPEESEPLDFVSVFPCGQDLCAANRLAANRKVHIIRLDGSDVCSARTTERFSFDDPVRKFEGTFLSGGHACAKSNLGVVGVDRHAVRPAKPMINEVAVSLDKLARNLIERTDTRATGSGAELYGLTSSRPLARAVGEVAILHYARKEFPPGPTVLSMNGKLFQLDGVCTTGHLFFFVNEALYLSYEMIGCEWGEHAHYVYDLSSGTPKQVYENRAFSG